MFYGLINVVKIMNYMKTRIRKCYLAIIVNWS